MGAIKEIKVGDLCFARQHYYREGNGVFGVVVDVGFWKKTVEKIDMDMLHYFNKETEQLIPIQVLGAAPVTTKKFHNQVDVLELNRVSIINYTCSYPSNLIGFAGADLDSLFRFLFLASTFYIDRDSFVLDNNTKLKMLLDDIMFLSNYLKGKSITTITTNREKLFFELYKEAIPRKS